MPKRLPHPSHPVLLLAAVVGDLTRCTDPRIDSTTPDDPEPAFFAVAERLAAFGLAGYRGAPIGHGTRNVALPFGARATLSPDGTLTVHTAAVS